MFASLVFCSRVFKEAETDGKRRNSERTKENGKKKMEQKKKEGKQEREKGNLKGHSPPRILPVQQFPNTNSKGINI